jgi:death-on-curing protein
VSDFIYLTLEDALAMMQTISIGPVRDIGLLDSALARPRSSAFAQDAYKTVGLKSAALLHSLTNNHPLVDGNKRLAWLATTVFLRLNGCESKATDDEAFDVVWDLASGSLELDEIEQRMKIASQKEP